MRSKSISSLTLIIIAICLLFSLSSCQNQYRKDYEMKGTAFGDRKADDSITRADPAYTDFAPLDRHQHTSFHWDLKATDQIMTLPGVGLVYVMVAGDNAYVAVALDAAATGTIGSGDHFRKDQLGSINVNPDYEVHPLNVVTDANSLITFPGHAAENLSHNFKQKIASKIRTKNPKISQVFISADRAIINQFNVYAVKTHLGQSLDEDIQQFNEWVQQYFVKH